MIRKNILCNYFGRCQIGQQSSCWCFDPYWTAGFNITNILNFRWAWYCLNSMQEWSLTFLTDIFLRNTFHFIEIKHTQYVVHERLLIGLNWCPHWIKAIIWFAQGAATNISHSRTATVHSRHNLLQPTDGQKQNYEAHAVCVDSPPAWSSCIFPINWQELKENCKWPFSYNINTIKNIYFVVTFRTIK